MLKSCSYTALALALVMPLAASHAMSRAELAQIKAPSNGDFQYWAADSAAKKALVQFVEAAVNKGSAGYIPPADRVAVFDLDGTIYGETSPTYFGWIMYFDRMFADPNYKPSARERDLAARIHKAWEEGKSGAVNADQNQALVRCTAGLTEEEFFQYVDTVLDKPVEGLTNLKYGEMFYLPMLEVMSYLVQHDFDVYMVSASEREVLRAICRGVLPIPVSHLIASDMNYAVRGVEKADTAKYMFKKDDTLVLGDTFLGENGGIKKPFTIAAQIGVHPVLAFGNSSGDYSMFNYTLANPKYKGAAFALLCDDLEREHGNLKKAEKVRQKAEENGWHPVSMAHDFTTIYGENVKKVF